MRSTLLVLGACGLLLAFYVLTLKVAFMLVDSATHEIFYVGKGKGKRYAQHVSNCERENNTATACGDKVTVTYGR